MVPACPVTSYARQVLTGCYPTVKGQKFGEEQALLVMQLGVSRWADVIGPPCTEAIDAWPRLA